MINDTQPGNGNIGDRNHINRTNYLSSLSNTAANGTQKPDGTIDELQQFDVIALGFPQGYVRTGTPGIPQARNLCASGVAVVRGKPIGS